MSQKMSADESSASAAEFHSWTEEQAAAWVLTLSDKECSESWQRECIDGAFLMAIAEMHRSRRKML